MTTLFGNAGAIRPPARISVARAEVSDQGYQAYQILRLGFTAAPIIAGIDKYLGLLVDWQQYLPPVVDNMLGGRGAEFMYLVGAIEIAAGIGVFLKPKIFAYVVAAWLGLIIVNLLLIPGYFDIALRDFGLMLAAIALGRLSMVYAGASQNTGK